MHGLRTFEVKLSDDRVVQRHLDHIRYQTTDQAEEIQEDLPLDLLPVPEKVSTQETPPPMMELRRSSRAHCPPDRYTPDIN